MDAPQPPLPPQIAAQQAMPPLRQFAAGNPMAGVQSQMQQAPSMQLVEGMMNEVTANLEKVAQIVVNEKPELLPLLKPVVQGLAMFMGQIKANQGGPMGGNQGTAQDMAPDAPGGAAMGLPPQ